jgi:hypothetical protein
MGGAPLLFFLNPSIAAYKIDLKKFWKELENSLQP